MKLRLAILAGLLHLGLACLSPLSLVPTGKIGDWIRGYHSLTGASADFKFFAPTVGAPIQAELTVTAADGRVTRESLGETNRELALRIGNLVDAFGEDLSDARTRQAVAASLANYIAHRHPDADRLQVSLRQYDLPSLGDFARGAAASWQTLYHADFVAEGDRP